MPNVDAVFVLNSDEYHAETAIAALEAGKHVFVEKPMCLTLADARAMQAARDRAACIARAARVKHIGFSTKTCFPASSAAMAVSA